MKTMRLAAVVGTLASIVFLSGCICSVTNLDSERKLTGYKVKPQNPDIKIVVPAFHKSQVQQFDRQVRYSGDYMVTSWRELPGETDISLKVAKKLRKAGFQNVTIDANAEGDYYLVGGLFVDQGIPGDGEAIASLTWLLIACVPACVLPIPIGGPTDGNMIVSVYGREKGKPLLTRKVVYRWRIWGFSIWGCLFGDARDHRIDAAANVAAEMLNELEQGQLGKKDAVP